jgi:hypothetical protein
MLAKALVGETLLEEGGPMQTIGAYLIFMLAMLVFGLSVILSGVVLIALYEGANWLWARSHFSQTFRSHSVFAHR